MIIRSKTKYLFEGKPLIQLQQQNSEMNIYEIESNQLILQSKLQRLVLELTNACNLNCIMCGRNSIKFNLTQLNMKWFLSLEPLFEVVEEVTLLGWGEPTLHPQFEDMLCVLDNYSARKYFCTNGMQLDKIHNAIFKYNVDLLTVSLDEATCETNAAIRIGSDLEYINNSLCNIVAEKKKSKSKYPYINYVFCAMKRNLHELSSIVEMAADIGLDEVKVVYLTVFNENFTDETLYGYENDVKASFDTALERENNLGVTLKLPYIYGYDPANEAYHRDCFVAYRDFYLGSDGYVCPCMSTAEKFFLYDLICSFDNMWNSLEFQSYRKNVNTINMPNNCKHCYQSSHCNWNNRKSYI